MVERRLVDKRIDARLDIEIEQIARRASVAGVHCMRISMERHAIAARMCKSEIGVQCALWLTNTPQVGRDLPAARGDGLRRRGRRRRPGRARGRDPSQAAQPDISVVVVEKGSEVGAHILSGAVIDPIGLDRLLPEWRTKDTPLKTAVTDDRFYYLSASGAHAAAEFHDAAADEQSRQFRRLARRVSAAGWPPRPRRSASRSIRASRRPKCCSTRTARLPASPPATWASARRASRKDSFTRGMELRAQVHAVRRRRARQAGQELIAQIRSRGGTRTAEIRHRPEGAVAGGAGEAPNRAWCSIRSAGRSTNDRRRLVPLPPRGQSGVGRLRRAPQLFRIPSFAVRRISALQDASAHPRTFDGGKRLSYGARAITEGG